MAQPVSKVFGAGLIPDEGEPVAGPQEEVFALNASRGFADRLQQSGGSIAFSTGQAGKLFQIGPSPERRLSVFDLASGEMIPWLRMEGVMRELFDVAFLPGIRRPALVGFKSDEVKRVILISA